MKEQEILFRTEINFTNELTFLDFSKIENKLIQKEEKRINRIISVYNDLATSLQFYIPAKVKMIIQAEMEKIDIEIDFFINNLNVDMKEVTAFVNSKAA